VSEAREQAPEVPEWVMSQVGVGALGAGVCVFGARVDEGGAGVGDGGGGAGVGAAGPLETEIVASTCASVSEPLPPVAVTKTQSPPVDLSAGAVSANFPALQVPLMYVKLIRRRTRFLTNATRLHEHVQSSRYCCQLAPLVGYTAAAPLVTTTGAICGELEPGNSSHSFCNAGTLKTQMGPACGERQAHISECTNLGEALTATSLLATRLPGEALTTTSQLTSQSDLGEALTATGLLTSQAKH
jgi:hypothetical protein